MRYQAIFKSDPNWIGSDLYESDAEPHQKLDALVYSFLRNYKYDEIIYSSNLDNFLIIFYSLKVQFKTCQHNII